MILEVAGIKRTDVDLIPSFSFFFIDVSFNRPLFNKDRASPRYTALKREQRINNAPFRGEHF